MQTMYLLWILLHFIIEGGANPPDWTIPASTSISIASTDCDDVTTLSADSGDGSSVIYSLISQTPTGGGFTITDHFSGNKILTCVQGSITEASYEVVVRARHDGGNNKQSDLTLTITFTDVAPAAAPEFVKPSPNEADDDHPIALLETIQAGKTVLTLTATDEDTDDATLTFNMDASAEVTRELFEMNGKELKVKDGVSNDYFDAEKDGVVLQYPIVLEVSDGGSSTTLSTTINVQDVNDNSPEFSGTFTTEIRNDVPEGYTVFTITATDSDKTATNNNVILSLSEISAFNLDGDKIKVSAGVIFDVKTQSSYTLTVTASDNALVDPKTTDQDFNVTIKAAPEFVDPDPDDNLELQIIYMRETIQAGDEVMTLKASDADTDAALLNFNMDNSSLATKALFEVVGVKLKVKADVNTTVFDFDADNAVIEYSIILGVTDGDYTTTLTTTIRIEDDNDNAPEFSGDTTAYILESSPAGTSVLNLTASDKDKSAEYNNVTFSLSGAAEFEIGGDNNDVILVANGASFDYETISSYTLTITASDNAPEEAKTTDQNITVGITTGLVTRYCNSDDTLPQYDCVRESVKEVEEKVSSLNANASENDVNDVLIEINKVTAQNESTQAEDSLTDVELNVLSSSLETVAEVLVASAGIINDEITENFLESASNLIDDSNKESWQSLTESESSGAENVLRAVDYMAEALSKAIESSEKNKTIIIKKNIAIEVKTFSNEGFIFPDPAENEPGEDDDDTKWLTESQSRLQLDAKSLKNDTVKYVTTAVIYRDMSEILPTKQTNVTNENSDDAESEKEEVVINSPILSLTIYPPVSEKLNPPITFTFEQYSKNFTDPTCVFWSFQSSGSGSGFWSTDGCAVNTTNENFTVCQCDHLTNFAVLMSPFKEADASSDAHRIISMVGIGISIACLIVTLVLHFCLWKYLRNDRTTALINLCVALLFSYIIFLAGIDRTESTAACAAIAAVLQYIYLVVFCIMLVEGIEIAVTVLYVFKTKSRIKIMLVPAWVIPAVIVGISLGVSKLEGYGNENFCWLTADNGLIWAFVGPALFIIIFNGICLIIVMRVMFQTKFMKTKTASEKIKTSFRSLCVLVPVLGVSWLLGIFYINDSFYFIQYIFAILNGLQGFFIFLFHCLLNPQVKKALMLLERRRSSAKETLKSTFQRSTSKEERKPKNLRDTGKAFVDNEEFAQDSSNAWKDKILQTQFSRQEVKFSTPLGFYGNGRRVATFNAESRDKLTSSRPYSVRSQNLSDQLQTK